MMLVLTDGSWTNPRWLTVLASIDRWRAPPALAGPCGHHALSGGACNARVTAALGGLIALGPGALGVLEIRNTRRNTGALQEGAVDRAAWRMPPLVLLNRPVWSPTG